MADSYLTIPEPTDQLAYRLWKSIAVRENGCWEWTGKVRSEKGYGSINFQRKNYRTHRIAFRLYYGIDPRDKFVCHSCDNPSCCNPFHLFLGSNADNVADKINKNRHILGTHSASSKLTPAKVLKIRQMWASGRFTQKVIAEVIGVHRGTVLQVINKRTWTHVKGFETPKLSRFEGDQRAALHRRGEKAVNAKLTEEQVLEIRNLYKNQWSITAISKRYPVTFDAVWRIVHRKTWKHI